MSHLKKKNAYEVLTEARSSKRPKITDYYDNLFTDFYELKGDRLSGEDPAILGGIAMFEGEPVTVIGHRKGNDLMENIRFNFGMPEPQGYRKAARLMKEAERFGRPVITFIDTPGAYPGRKAEENGQSTAIAENLALMSTLRTPLICIVTGEACSGGALAIAAGDCLIMLENSVYSVLSPEGMASILWKDPSRVAEACEQMKMTADILFKEGIADEVIKEDYASLKRSVSKHLKDLKKLDADDLVQKRYEKYRLIGKYVRL